MDSYEGSCRLEWWANPVTCLGSFAVSVVIAATATGWSAQGRLASADDEEREGFAFFCELDPVFDLRFDDESLLSVTVHPAREDGTFTLTECAEN